MWIVGVVRESGCVVDGCTRSLAPAWVSTKKLLARRLRAGVLSCHATVNVPSATARTVSQWIAAHRRVHDTRPWQRAATLWVQAVMLLRRLIEATSIAGLARDAGVWPASAYRYLHEALDVVAHRAPDLPQTLQQPRYQGEPFLCAGGTLIRTNWVAARNPENSRHLWYCGKHKAFGSGVQVLIDHTDLPVLGLAGQARLHPRHHRRPRPRAARPVQDRLPGHADHWRRRAIPVPGQACSPRSRAPGPAPTTSPTTTSVPPCEPRPSEPTLCSTMAGFKQNRIPVRSWVAVSAGAV